MIHIRRATPADSRAMADLLNAIIALGGTTAKTTPVTGDILSEWMTQDGSAGAWHLAEDDTGMLLGFQSIGPKEGLPYDACDIATFVRVGQTGLGIGSRLFKATKQAAHDLGYSWINATIRADNESGLTYYQSRGFEDWKRVEDSVLDDGTVVARICKRYDL
ncbi:GNAT family N-acetyltransferase [Alisedimentitalea sp. MJ-SS2]|uniref:GNAT family N-acetyltransferase n=1 Tax=Aliisedimentitalea sp. MJ-SS2 TaxID=3049795 RepID=UPI002914D5BF|nr:GNAT family N-acetyltransferase [Alisedimentitalea sp. MJ-SS2]MDU8927941.1 GNAT family N-acetyltransferase [Alisedimentitalea sp. MJ-SS2]